MDLIERSAAIESLGEEPLVWMWEDYELAERAQWRRDKAAIESVPSAQPEIILCKDCTWCQDDTIHGKVFCSREGAMDRIEPDSYCSYGERETDGIQNG